jgi:hypothetical protein
VDKFYGMGLLHIAFVAHPHQVPALLACSLLPSSRNGMGDFKTERRVLAALAKPAIGLSICLADHISILSLISDTVSFPTYILTTWY